MTTSMRTSTSPSARRGAPPSQSLSTRNTSVRHSATLFQEDTIYDAPPHAPRHRKIPSSGSHTTHSHNYHTDPLYTPPYIYTPSTPPDTIPSPKHIRRQREKESDCDWLAATRSIGLGLCEDEFDLRLRELHDAAKSLAAQRAAEQTCLLQAHKLHKRRQKCLRRALELHDACLDGIPESECEDPIAEEVKRVEDEERWRKKSARWTVKQARATYERNWTVLAKSPCSLSFSTIPWPVLTRPSGPESMTQDEISAFLVGVKSGHPKRKERVKDALKRWHPDKFARFTGRVEDEKDRAVVLEAAGNVARCLNELL